MEGFFSLLYFIKPINKNKTNKIKVIIMIENKTDMLEFYLVNFYISLSQIKCIRKKLSRVLFCSR